MQAALEGKKIEVFVYNSPGMGWILNNNPQFNWEQCDYRVALTKSYINPDHVSKKYKWMATDENKATFLYTEKPELHYPTRWAGPNMNCEMVHAEGFSSFVLGICDWKECLRVLKPGGYLLSFAGTRTQHRMAVNIEDAGFEIRDMIAWLS